MRPKIMLTLSLTEVRADTPGPGYCLSACGLPTGTSIGKIKEGLHTTREDECRYVCHHVAATCGMRPSPPASLMNRAKGWKEQTSSKRNVLRGAQIPGVLDKRTSLPRKTNRMVALLQHRFVQVFHTLDEENQTCTSRRRNVRGTTRMTVGRSKGVLILTVGIADNTFLRRLDAQIFPYSRDGVSIAPDEHHVGHPVKPTN